MITVGIVDTYEARHNKLRKNLAKQRFTVNYSVLDRELSSEMLNGISVDILFVHINDVSSSLRENLRSAPCKLVFVYSGGSLPSLSQDEANSGKIFNIAFSVAHDGTVGGGGRQDFLTVDECGEIKQFLMNKTKTLSFVQGGSMVSQINNLRPQILTPFVLLHLGLQMEMEKKGSFGVGMEEEERSCCEEGLKLLGNSWTALKELFLKLLGLSRLAWKDVRDQKHPAGPIARDLDCVIQEFGSEYEGLFNALSRDNGKNPLDHRLTNRKRLTLERSLNGESVELGVLEAIEELARVVEDAVVYQELSDQVRSFRHDCENVSRALSGYINAFESNKPDSKKNLQDLDPGLINKLLKNLPSLSENSGIHTWNTADELLNDINRAVRDASESYTRMRSVLLGVGETATKEQIITHGNSVISKLQEAERLTLQIAPKISTTKKT